VVNNAVTVKALRIKIMVIGQGTTWGRNMFRYGSNGACLLMYNRSLDIFRLEYMSIGEYVSTNSVEL